MVWTGTIVPWIRIRDSIQDAEKRIQKRMAGRPGYGAILIPWSYKVSESHYRNYRYSIRS